MMTNVDTDRLVKVISAFKDEIKDEFRHQLGIQSGNVQHKLDLVVEGHQMLSEKLDRAEKRLDQRMDNLKHKTCGVKADLSNKIDSVNIDLSNRIDAVNADLSNKIGFVESRLAEKIDAVAVDLKEHRADTEAHHPVSGKGIKNRDK